MDSGIIINIFRMEVDDHFGLRREPVTCTEYELDVFNYCLAKIGALINKGSMKQMSVKLPDLNAQRVYEIDVGEKRALVSLQALVPNRASGEDGFPTYAMCADGFDYSPYGPGASSFGFFCKTTIAWIVPHRDIPVLLFKATSADNVIAVEKFLDTICTLDAIPWPIKPAEKTLIVPEAMTRTSVRPGAMRKARARSKVARQHLRSR